jgi:hypothetical protein
MTEPIVTATGAVVNPAALEAYNRAYAATGDRASALGVLVEMARTEDLHRAVTATLGRPDGYLLGWRPTGCQLVSLAYRRLLPCPHREGIWQCEVVGPHIEHRWSDHLKVHERLGNGHSCRAIGDLTLADLYRRPADEQPTKIIRVGF